VESVEKDLELRTLSLLIEFIAFIAIFLVTMQPLHYQRVDPTAGLIFIQGYVVRMKFQTIISELHEVSGSDGDPAISFLIGP